MGSSSGRRESRLWEIDLLRTIAIAMMVVYHVAYDIRFLAPDVAIDPYNGGWRALQVVCASTFVTVVGLSYWVATRRAHAIGIRGLELWRRNARRGAQVLAAALLVSVATLVALGPDDAVRFGILHLIAVATLVVLPLLVRLGAWNAVIGTALIAAGLLLNNQPTGVQIALILGLDPGDTGVDWYPMLPWIGVALVGVALGAALYPDGERGRWTRRLERMPSGAWLAGAPGRRSLTIYLVHQPVLIVLTGVALTLSGTPLDGL